MCPSGTPASALLDAWREQHADRLDPLRFHFIEALARRAAGHSGEARRLLDDKLSRLLQAYAEQLENAAARGGEADGDAKLSAPARGALGALLDDIAIAGQPATRDEAPAVDDAAARRAAFPELGALDDFRNLWSRLRSESQLRQSLEHVPTNAGPLNSGSLVHRSLSLMRELSPGYLQQFLAYVDALSWMEQINDGGALAVKEPPMAVGARKRARTKPGERRD